MKKTNILLVLLALSLPVYAQAPATPQGPPSPAPATPAAPAAPTVPQVPAAKPPVPNAPAVPGQPAAPAPPVPGAANPANPVNPAVANVPQPAKHNPEALAARTGQVIDGSNWDDQDVADEYTKYTGKRVLLSSATQNLEIRFYQRGPLTNRQAADLLVKVLDMEGFVFVPSGANEVKLLPKAQGTGSNGPAELEGIIDNPADIPEGDNYISYFMKLGFIKPEEAVRTFTQSIHGLGPGAKIAPVPNASAVLITGKAAFVRKLINQQKYIDVPTGNVDTAWVTLKYGDAEEVATTLNEIMNAQQQRKTTAGVTTAGAAAPQSGNRPPVPGRQNQASQQAGATAAGEDIPVQIVASPRLNKIFIMGRPVDIVFVEGLAREFDAPPNRNNFVKRKLRFMIASDFLNVAADALEAAAGPSASGGNRAGGTTRGNRQTTQNRNTGSTNRNTGGQGGNRTGGESVQEFNVSDVPESIVVGKTFIVADNLENSILVQGPPESLRIVTELIDKLDGRPQQVMISTVFGQLNLNKTNEFGISAGRGVDPGGNSSGAGLLNNGLGSVLDTEGLAGIGDIPQGDGTAGLTIYGRVGNYQLLMKALNSNSDFKVLSRPTVFAANNRRAVISSGQRVAVPTNTFQSGANTGQTQSTNIEFRDVVLKLEVVPLINSADEVTLRISLLNDQIVGNQLIDGNEIPTIGTEEISTTVTVPNESTVVLGGLVTERDEKSKSGVPVLSSIPGLGRLFSRTETKVDRRELLIFIQPKIVGGDESLNRAQADIERPYDVSKPTRDFGNGVLPSKSKSKSVAPRKESSKKAIPTASQRPYLRYPTRR